MPSDRVLQMKIGYTATLSDAGGEILLVPRGYGVEAAPGAFTLHAPNGDRVRTAGEWSLSVDADAVRVEGEWFALTDTPKDECETVRTVQQLCAWLARSGHAPI